MKNYEQESWTPNKKWYAALVTGLGSVAGLWITTSAFPEEAVGALVVALAGAYFKREN